MIPKIYNAEHLFNPELMDFDRSVEIHVTRFLKNNNPQHILKNYSNSIDNTFIIDAEYPNTSPSFKVYVDSSEPKVCYMKEIDNDIILFSSFYDLILTSNQDLLKLLPNSKLFLYGTTWLNKHLGDTTYLGYIDDNFDGFSILKDNTISFLITNKSQRALEMVEGYRLRKKIWNLKQNINMKTLFYYSNTHLQWKLHDEHDGILPNDDKMELFKSKFSIIIENSQEKNYFSEKLIDCLITKTVPIYWGCPNIGDYFDLDGFIIFENENDFLNKINSIDLKSYYLDKQVVIEHNFNEAKKYAINYSKRLETIIKENLNV
jgi:hypothetical protein